MKTIAAGGLVLLALGAVSARADDQPLDFSLKGFVVENVGYAANDKLDKAPAGARPGSLAEQDDATLSAVAKAVLGEDVTVSLQGDIYGTGSSLTRSTGGGCRQDAPAVFDSRCATNFGIKRAFATLASPAGTLIVGDREDATVIVHNSAPDVSPFARSGGGYYYYWVAAPANHRNLTQDTDARYDDSADKVSYVSPAFHNVTGVLTYVPRLSSSIGTGSPTPATAADYGVFLPGGQASGANLGGDAYGGGFYYSDSLDGVGIKADATLLEASVANLRIYQQGIQLAYAGFTLGASSMIRDVPDNVSINDLYSDAQAAALGGAGTTAAAIAKAAVFAGNSYTLGLRYAIGPYSLSTSVFHDNAKSLAALNGSGRADSTDVYDFGVADDLGTPMAGGPRVVVRAGIAYVTYRGSVANAAAPWANNNSGLAAVTGVRLDF